MKFVFLVYGKRQQGKPSALSIGTGWLHSFHLADDMEADFQFGIHGHHRHGPDDRKTEILVVKNSLAVDRHTVTLLFCGVGKGNRFGNPVDRQRPHALGLAILACPTLDKLEAPLRSPSPKPLDHFRVPLGIIRVKIREFPTQIKPVGLQSRGIPGYACLVVLQNTAETVASGLGIDLDPAALLVHFQSGGMTNPGQENKTAEWGEEVVFHNLGERIFRKSEKNQPFSGLEIFNFHAASLCGNTNQLCEIGINHPVSGTKKRQTRQIRAAEAMGCR